LTLPLVIVRPEPGASTTVARAYALELAPHSHPLFETRALDWSLSDPANFDAVLITSANAARLGGAGLARLTSLPVIAVGDASASAAQDAGFGDVRASVGDGAAAVRLAAAAGYRHVLHLCGHDFRALAHADIAISPLHVFVAAPLPPAPALLDCLAAPCVALAHSPRAAARLAELAPERAHIDLVTISAAASGAAGSGWRSCQHAATPEDTAMLALAAPLCCNASRTI
jgi:uroporphyrinogen-III synthase